MANFIQEKYNSMPEQVEENKKNIKELIDIIKPVYKSNLELNDTDTSTAISDTNAPSGTVDGWLIDTIGNVFKINGGDDSSLLIEFYTSIRGEKGEKGDDGVTAIDDDVKSLVKTWSSQKISDKIDLISDKGIYYTFVQPTLVDSTYQLNTSDLENPNQYTFQKINDIIVYIDGNGKVKDFYKCVAVQGDFSKIYLEKVGEIGGKKLYQNNIYINSLKWTSGDTRYFVGVINLILDVELTTKNDFINWYKSITSDVVCDGIGMGYGNGYISHLRKLRIPSIVSDKVVAKFDIIHNLNGSVIFTDNQSSSSFLEDQDIRVESRLL